MKVREIVVPEELDERLRAWARYFKDRHLFTRCKSLEGRFNAHAPGSWDEGWGEPSPPVAPVPLLNLNQVLETHAAINDLPKDGRWAITYGYCYPSLERWRVLKFMRKYTGRRFTWNEYLHTLDMGRLRVWAAILNKKTSERIDSRQTFCV